MRRKIEDLLDKLQFNIANKGYEYWIELIEIYLKDERKQFVASYEEIANIHNVSISSVERNLRTLSKKNMKVIQKHFNVSYDVTSSALICLILREFKRGNI